MLFNNLTKTFVFWNCRWIAFHPQHFKKKNRGKGRKRNVEIVFGWFLWNISFFFFTSSKSLCNLCVTKQNQFLIHHKNKNWCEESLKVTGNYEMFQLDWFFRLAHRIAFDVSFCVCYRFPFHLEVKSDVYVYNVISL